MYWHLIAHLGQVFDVRNCLAQMSYILVSHEVHCAWWYASLDGGKVGGYEASGFLQGQRLAASLSGKMNI